MLIKTKDIVSNSYKEAPINILTTLPRMREGSPLTAKEIEKIITDFVAKKIPDYQMSAWLATITCLGMTIDEIEALTKAYVAGGKPINFSGIGQKIVDKHSTGGVGDKVSLIVVPLVAACGIPVAKISGRGLGHAGGTLDKLESLSGLKLNLSAEEARTILETAGMFITGQSSDLAPGDKATYLLRDATGSVESIPLIAASIISKKVAIGADGLVLDIKTGSGALIQDPTKAMQLAELMVELASRFGIECRAILSNMSHPLGYAIGNVLEIKEALSVLQGKIIPDLTDLCLTLASLMLQVADPLLSNEEAHNKIIKVITNGLAYEKFVYWATIQGAEHSQLKDLERLQSAPKRKIVIANKKGWVQSIEPRAIGNASLCVGGGRLIPDARIDYSAGIILNKQIGESVSIGDILAEIHYTSGDIALAENLIHSAFFIGENSIGPSPIVQKIIESKKLTQLS